MFPGTCTNPNYKPSPSNNAADEQDEEQPDDAALSDWGIAEHEDIDQQLEQAIGPVLDNKIVNLEHGT